MLAIYGEACENNGAVVLFPELSITGATCGDLFFQDILIDGSLNALKELKAATAGRNTALIAGLPIRRGHLLYNCAAVISGGKILGVTVKTLPGRERRHFTGCPVEQSGTWEFDGESIPFGSGLIYDCGGFSFAVEFADELNSPLPPSSRAVLDGAQAIFCLGARPFTLQDATALESAVVQRSASLCAIYAYANAGRGESTTSAAYSGGVILAENGQLRYSSEPFAGAPETGSLDFIPRWLMQLRRRHPAFTRPQPCPAPALQLPAAPQVTADAAPAVSRFPFIPEDPAECSMLCNSIIDTQAEALAQRVRCCNAQRLVLGVSGGLDSTMALLACVRCCQLL
jgi:NAD+ synthase (glutamine-hydrolysing)